MDKVIEIDPIQDTRWDAFVNKHSFGWVVHLSGWKQVLETTFPHMKGHYLTLINETTGEIRAALPVFEVNSWILGRRLVSIPFATLCDPLVSQGRDVESLLDRVIDLSRQVKASMIEIRTIQSPSMMQDGRLAEGKLFKHHSIILDKSLEELKMKLHRTAVRKEITKADKLKLTLKVAESESDVHTFYDIYQKARRRLDLPAQPYEFFKSLWTVFHTEKRVRLLLAQKDGNIISGLIVLTYKDRCSAEYIGTDIAYRDVSADHYLIWQAIRMAHCEKFKIFDFGRTAITHENIMIFKSRWGTEVTDLPQYYYPPNGAVLSSNLEESLSYRLIRKICHHAPEAFFPYIGKFCYRHLG